MHFVQLECISFPKVKSTYTLKKYGSRGNQGTAADI